MEDYIGQLISTITDYMEICGPVLGIVLIILESIFPVLPLAVFIGINQMVFGSTFGFIISWISTIIGCYVAFMICRLGFSNILYKKISDNESLQKLMKRITRIKFSNLVIMMALPFTPAFMFNIAGGLSKIDTKKFMSAVFISKLSVVYFWGYVGGTFLESLTDKRKLISVGVALLIAYLLSLIVSKKFNVK